MKQCSLEILIILTVMLSASTQGEEPTPNFFLNPGFEQNFQMTVENWYDTPLRDNISSLPDGTASMPQGMRLLATGGASDNKIEYVKGTPGQEVHSGEYALRVIAPGGVVISVGAGWPVDDEKTSHAQEELLRVSETENAENLLIQRGKRYAVDFYAKGSGTIGIVIYPFDQNSSWMGGVLDPEGAVMMEIFHDGDEEAFVVQEESWTRYHGTLQILAKSVEGFRFALQIKGDIWLDDISLTPDSEKIPEPH